jgi:nitrate/nitrite transporter NarK
VVPFVSKRATGLVSGFVGAGGNAGGAITQVLLHWSEPSLWRAVWGLF